MLEANFKKNMKWFICLGVILLYFVPFFINGASSFITIHDNMDSVFVNSKVLAESGMIFSSSENIIPQYNIPRLSFGSEFNIFVFVFLFLPPFWAYVFVLIFIKIVAFIGMFLLLQKHFLKNENEKIVCFGVALCFALLPYYAFTLLSIAGQPFALYAFLNIRNKQSSIYDWLILIILPFLSSFIYAFFFFIIFIGMIFLYDLISRKHFNIRFFAAITTISAIYLATEYRIILNTISPLFIPHRAEYAPNFLSLTGGLLRGFKNFIYGQYHAPSLQTYVILPTIFISAMSVFWLKKTKIDNEFFVGFLLIFMCFSISIFYGLWYSVAMQPIRETIPLLTEVNFARFHWLHPGLWHLIFALSLLILLRYIPYKKATFYLVYLLLTFQLFIVGFKNHEFIVSQQTHGISYKSYVAEELFQDIKNYIGAPLHSYRVVSIGMHPTIAAYNGFHTFDLYTQYYPLERKHQFREAIEKELSKAPDLAEKFDTWGNRLYFYNNTTGHDMLGVTQEKSIKNLEINREIFKEAGVKYLLSRVPIKTGLQFEKKFTHPYSHWTVYLYKI